jgi:hypothetical protein
MGFNKNNKKDKNRGVNEKAKNKLNFSLLLALYKYRKYDNTPAINNDKTNEVAR